MHEVSLFRLYLLRAVYLIIAVGLGLVIWPTIIHHSKPWELMGGVVNCTLGAFGLLCALGVRYPLQMLPILFWEMIWKFMWLFLVARPLWLTGQMDEETWGVATACLVVLIIPPAIPWRYVYHHYIAKSADRWR